MMMSMSGDVSNAAMKSYKCSCSWSLNILSLTHTEESNVGLRPDKDMHQLANDFSICSTILFLDKHRLLLGGWKVHRDINLELTISMKWYVYCLQVLYSGERKEHIDNGLPDVLGLIKGYTLMYSDNNNTQVKIFKFHCLLVSNTKIAFQLHCQAGVSAIMGIGAEKIIS